MQPPCQADKQPCSTHSRQCSCGQKDNSLRSTGDERPRFSRPSFPQNLLSVEVFETRFENPFKPRSRRQAHTGPGQSESSSVHASCCKTRPSRLHAHLFSEHFQRPHCHFAYRATKFAQEDRQPPPHATRLEAQLCVAYVARARLVRARRPQFQCVVHDPKRRDVDSPIDPRQSRFIPREVKLYPERGPAH